MLIDLTPELETRLRIACGPRADSAMKILKEGEQAQPKAKKAKKETPSEV